MGVVESGSIPGAQSMPYGLVCLGNNLSNFPAVGVTPAGARMDNTTDATDVYAYEKCRYLKKEGCSNITIRLGSNSSQRYSAVLYYEYLK